MKMITSKEMFNESYSRDLITLECEQCHKHFAKKKHYVQAAIKNKNKAKFCSKECAFQNKLNGQEYPCANCGAKVYRNQAELNHKHRKSKLVFCNHSCACSYNNAHKTTGTRRSKLEIYIEKQLLILYPNLKFDFNQTNAISAELDIYIPELKLAFELNGIFHYEPIFGIDKLNKTQSNDKRKFQACAENDISLCVIDTSKIKYFKESTSKPILDIIVGIINSKLARDSGFEPDFSVPSTAKNLEDSPD